MEEMIKQKKSSLRHIRRLRRRGGAATSDGPEYEYKLAGLLALRARIEGLQFEIHTNVDVAHPCDDIVLIVRGPEPAIVFVQLKHGKESNPLRETAFVSAEGDFSLKKYFEFYKKYLEKLSARESLKDEDEKYIYAYPLADVRFAIFTNRGVRRSEEAWEGEDQGLPFPLEGLFRTGSSRTEEVFSFGERDARVWQLFKNDPQEELYLDFLSHLRFFAGQSNSRGLDALIKEELNKLYGGPLPGIDLLLHEYLNRLKVWAQDPRKKIPLFTASHEVEELLAVVLRKRARGLAADLVFQEAQYGTLRNTLRLPGDLYVCVRGVAAGHRAAKVQQILNDDSELLWTYVDDESLRAYPLAALRAACGACAVVVVDAEVERQRTLDLVAAVPSGRKLVVLRSDSHALFLRESSSPVTTLQEHWCLDQLTPQAQEKLMESEVLFQGSMLQLRDLETSWPSLRQDVDGALLSALVEGKAVVGALPDVDDHEKYYVARTVAHASILNPTVFNHPASSDHLVLKGFSREELQKLQIELKGNKRREDHHFSMGNDVLGNRLTAIHDDEASSDLQTLNVFMKACAQHPNHNVHLVEKVQKLLLWRVCRGSSDAVAAHVQPVSRCCRRPYEPTCRHEESDWTQRVHLLVGEPGIGKSTFLLGLAADKRKKFPHHWVVVARLLSHGKLLEDMPQPQDMGEKAVLDLVCAAAGVAAPESRAARRSVEAALLHSGNIHIFVDGVDEVVPAYKDKALRLLELLLHTKVATLWVASRPQVDKSLSCLLKCVPLSLLPLSRSQQLIYLRMRWASSEEEHTSEAVEELAMQMVDAFAKVRSSKSEFNPFLHLSYLPIWMTEEFENAVCLVTDGRVMPKTLENTILYAFHTVFLRNMETDISRLVEETIKETRAIHDKFYNKPSDFHLSENQWKRIGKHMMDTYLENKCSLLGVPLHLRMAAEAFADDVQDALLSESRLLKGSLGLLDLFRRFLKKKRSHFWKICNLNFTMEKTTNIVVAEERIFNSLHESHAMQIWASVFPLRLRRPFEVIIKEHMQYLPKEKTGILWVNEDGDVEFAHRLFLEYFIAKWLFGNRDKKNKIENYLRLAFKTRSTNMVFFFLDSMLAEGLQLHNAVLQNDIDTLQAALSAGKGIECEDLGGRSPLHLAASYGRDSAVEKLLAAQLDLKKEDSLFGWTPLQYADESLELKCAEKLLSGGAKPQLSCTLRAVVKHPTILCRVAPFGLPKVLKTILHKKRRIKTNINKGARTSMLLLFLAAKNGHMEVIEELLKAGAGVKSCDDEMHPLYWACRNGHNRIVKLLLSRGTDVNRKVRNSMELIHVSAVYGNVDVTETLLNEGADIHSRDINRATPLHLAGMNGHSSLVDFLTNRGADVNRGAKNGTKPIHLSAAFGHVGATETLLKKGADIHSRDEIGKTPLHVATMECRTRVAQFLLSRGAQVNACIISGNTPLHMAAVLGHERMVDLLLDSRANIDSLDMMSYTPLHFAAREGYAQIVRNLVTKGSKVNTDSIHGQTPLHLAVIGGHSRAVVELLAAQADVNVQDELGSCPLHLAATLGHTAIVQLLLSRNADVCRRNVFGLSPVSMAYLYGRADIVQLLMQQVYKRSE